MSLDWFRCSARSGSGARVCNVHVRESRGGNARYALLFRDFLRADDGVRLAWGAFKQRLAISVPDLLDYGQIKAPATDVLMAAAERWAVESGWSAL
ncbi:MAG TPA: GrpB family protein [Actinoplanes sp.]|jgi:dephospho-CoA kinase